MVSINSGNDPLFINPIFESENDKKLHAEPHNPVIVSEVDKEGINNPTNKEEYKFINTLREKWIAVQQHTRLTPLIIAMAIVGALLQIPTILYYTDPPSAEVTVLDNIDLENCSIINPEDFQPSNMSLTLFCNESKLCFNSSEIEYQIFLILDQILQSVHDLSYLLENSQCSEAVQQLFCNAINKTNGDSNMLMKDCLRIRDDKCAAEWRVAEIFFDVPLPSCISFNESESLSLIFEGAPVLSCPKDFGIFCGSLCQPLCAEISLFNDAATVAYKVLNIILHTMSVIAGVITLIICCVHKRKMFGFPLIFVVYNTTIFEIISLFLLLPYIFGPDDLLCSHPNLIVSNTKSTVFCQMQGLVVQSGTLVFFGFWNLHLFHLLYSLVFPLRSQHLIKSKQLKRSVHLIEVFIVLICGLLPSAIITGTSGYHYIGFPPICINEIPEVLFYTFIFPISIEATFGLCMLLISLWIIRKNFHITSSKTGYSTPEIKLIILFSYYGVSIITLLFYFVINLRSFDTIVDNVGSYTLCSAGGNRMECEGYREELNDDLIPTIVIDMILTVFISFVNIINLLYVLQYKDVKELFRKILIPITTLSSES